MHVAADFSEPVFLLAASPKLILQCDQLSFLPLPAVPEVPISKHGQTRRWENQIWLSREIRCTHLEAKPFGPN
jgi:hypothetical protein